MCVCVCVCVCVLLIFISYALDTTYREEQSDLAAEFEREREALLETIRDQAKQLAFFEALVDRVQPLVRRDCNYSNVERIRKVCV